MCHNPRAKERGGRRTAPLDCTVKGREMVLQGEVKAPLRERFFAKRNGRNAICLSPEGEFMAVQ